MSRREFDIVIWGSTSFTGRLVSEYIYSKYGNNGINWAMGGRNLEKLKKVREQVADEDVPIIVADSFDKSSIISMVSRTKVICSTVGPYSLYGSILVGSCVEKNTHYCDITGEVQWIRKMIDKYHEKGKLKNIKIVHSCGFDSIPSDMGVYFIQKELKKIKGILANKINMRVSGIRGGISGGTYASLNNVMKEAYSDNYIFKILSNPYGLNPTNEMNGPDGKELRSITYDNESNNWTSPFIMAGINTKIVRRSNALSNYSYGKDFKYNEATLTGKGLRGRINAIFSIIPLAIVGAKPGSLVKKMLDYFLPKPGEGPNKKMREDGFFNLRFYISLRDKSKAFAKVTGDMDPGYGSTSKMLAESALCLAFDELPISSGILTPSVAMGDALLKRLQENAGLNFSIRISTK